MLVEPSLLGWMKPSVMLVETSFAFVEQPFELEEQPSMLVEPPVVTIEPPDILVYPPILSIKIMFVISFFFSYHGFVSILSHCKKKIYIYIYKNQYPLLLPVEASFALNSWLSSSF